MSQNFPSGDMKSKKHWHGRDWEYHPTSQEWTPYIFKHQKWSSETIASFSGVGIKTIE